MLGSAKRTKWQLCPAFHDVFHQRRPLSDDVCGRGRLPSRLFSARTHVTSRIHEGPQKGMSPYILGNSLHLVHG